MKRLLASTALAAILPVLPAAAAVCTPANPIAGAVVTCTGTAPGAFRDADDGLTLNIAAGAAMIDPTDRDAIRVRGSGVTVNVGLGATVQSLGADGVLESVNVDDIDGADGIDGGDDLTVRNLGTIIADNKGIDAEGRNGLTVRNEGRIETADKAIRNKEDDDGIGGAGGQVFNSGTILSWFDEGVELGNDARVENAVGAVIEASDDAIQTGERATIINAGLIHSVKRGAGDTDPQDAIDIDSGFILNEATGIILSDDDAAIDHDASTARTDIVNHGTIKGTYGILVETGEAVDPETGEFPEANTGSQVIANHGTITGTNGTAIKLGAGNDALYNYGGSILNGAADFGADDDAVHFLGGFAGLAAGGALFDGGLGEDSAFFADYAFGDIASVSLAGSIYSMSLANEALEMSFNFRNWELFSFSDGVYDLAAIDALVEVAPVPLPAGMLLLGSAVFGLGALRRRRT
ncbi:VPLPA-CTERM sorting domain-containing protein [Cereibacter sp. SYSU M97828]|nr:VPLPA-CTERM sorting domain-containing protein [Cereibacter flavus]